ncbi:glycoside hydrolase family 43 protein [Mrakia frigida]|uniref:arabinan endo-1,5-alpha-L-arabinosidase n=1 Tax=Mrakia frigida TaxID=29902 RepID=UPI003FCC272A
MLGLPQVFTLFSALLTLSGVQAYPNPGTVNGAITGVHDPSVAKGADGAYILVSTGKGLPIRTSTDRITWTSAGTVFPSGAPSATDAYTGTSNGDLWAPDITYVGGKFLLYFSASTFGSKKSAIFLAQSTTGKTGTWTYSGLVTSTTTSSTYNAIDPHLYIEGSNWYLTLGSWSNGIQLFSLSSSTGKLASGAAAKTISTRSGGAEEASFLIKQGSYYYLFTSWDACCAGLSSTYNTRVVRSTSIGGSYVDQAGKAANSGGGTLVLASHGSIIGPGGGSLLADADGWVYFYHWYSATTSTLGVNLLDFSSGWPVAY